MESWRSARTERVLKVLENRNFANLVHDIAAVRDNCQWRVTENQLPHSRIHPDTFTVPVTESVPVGLYEDNAMDIRVQESP